MPGTPSVRVVPWQDMQSEVSRSISIPSGLAEPAGGGPRLPVGLQIAAPAFAESKLLDAAHAMERALAFDAVPESVR